MNYDVIVIGGGLGGLSAGAKLAKEGKKVLLLEQHSVGHLELYHHDPYRLSTSQIRFTRKIRQGHCTNPPDFYPLFSALPAN